MEPVFVALGSNLGDREAHLAFARAALKRLPHTRVVAVSRVEETDPVPLPDSPSAAQPRYLNQMVLLETGLEPRALLERLQAIESQAGRVRAPGPRWQPRTLDLDIVRFGDREVREPGLIVPHPELPRRDFWRRGIAELEARGAHRNG